MELQLPRVGMRTIKTAVAVMVCFFLFLPFWPYRFAEDGNPLALLSPFYACIAAIICMQSSVAQSVHQGVSRVIGTLLGSLTGVLLLLVHDLWPQGWLLGLLMGAGVVATIWLCNLISRPAACSIGCVVLCVVMLNHSGTDRYLYTLIRVAQTTVGILVAVAVNHFLPDRKTEPPADA